MNEVNDANDTNSSAHPPDMVFLSPHLDDAVLSVGALIARRVTLGQRVEVRTVFTKGPPIERVHKQFRVFAGYDQRHQEDEHALSLLGASYRWLGFGERIWREPRVRNTMGLFRTPKSVESFDNLDAIVHEIETLLDQPQVTIFAPLGVGNHYDHVEVALAAMRVLIARQAYGRLFFYEDMYATDAAARRRHFVTRRLTWGRFKSTGWANPTIGLLLRAGAWSARGPGIDTYLPDAAQLNWICSVEPLGEYEGAKLDAVAEYKSQVASIGGFTRVRSYIRSAHALCGGEPIWRADRRS